MPSDSLISCDPITTEDGAEILVRRAGTADAPRLFISHGNGLAVDAFGDLWRRLAGDFELVLFDVRSHGRNPCHKLQNHCWENFTTDVELVVTETARKYGEKEAFGLFHSLSALAALRAEARSPGLFTALVLIEPPYLPPPGHRLFDALHQDQMRLTEGARRRKAEFESVEALVERVKGRPVFSLLSEPAIGDYARAILREGDDGVWRLACPPEFEAKAFETNADMGLEDSVARVAADVLLLASGDQGLRARQAQHLAQAGGFKIESIDGVSHLMAMEAPDAVATAALQHLKLVRRR